MKPGTYDRKIIKFNENIKISKTRSTWLCACCHKKIEVGKETLIIYNCMADIPESVVPTGFGVRIHFECAEQLGKDLAFFRDKREKFKIINNLAK
jgi:hypothetical protein